MGGVKDGFGVQAGGDGNGTPDNIYNNDGSIVSDRTVNVGSALLEFTTAYGHNLIFTDDFLGQGWDFTGIYHNDSGVVYINGILDYGSVEYSIMAVMDNINNKNSYVSTSPQLAVVGHIPNYSLPTKINEFRSDTNNNIVTSKDDDADEYNLIFQASLGGGLYDQKASIYRDGAVATDSGFYIGDKTTDGSWRFVTSGADLVIQKRESGNWVTKQTITA